MPIEVIGQGAVTGLLNGGIIALIAIGLTLIWGVMGVLNMAHANFVMVALFVGYMLVKYLGIHPYLTIIVLVPLFFFLGILFTQYLIKPTLKISSHLALLITIAFMLFLEGIMTFVGVKVLKVDFIAVDPKYWLGTFNVGAIVIDTPLAIAFVASIVLALGLFWLIRKTDIGRNIRATAENPRTASLMGINVGRVQLIAFGIGISTAAVAASLMLPTIAFNSGIGNNFMLIAFVAVVLGGLGNFIGTFIAGFIVGFAEGMAGVFLPASLVPAVSLSILIFVLVFRPQGLFGDRGL
ncbi:branched-chain amino acid ABC transporter permease [Bacteroidota bacterium]